jgi:hypothetical protein
MGTAKSKKALDLMMTAPLMLFVFGQLLKMLLEIRFKIRRSRKHFFRGLVEAGVRKEEALAIVRECLNGRN